MKKKTEYHRWPLGG